MNQRGFSLLELLVAFSIMALSLGLLYRMTSGSARNLSDIEQQQQAAWLAGSILPSQQSEHADGWNEDGESAGYTWQVRSSPHPSGSNSAVPVRLHEIYLAIQWQGGQRQGQLELRTLRPERKPGPGEVVP